MYREASGTCAARWTSASSADPRNQQAHDTIGLRIETQGTELGKRIDAQGEKLGERIDALEVRLARTSEDVSFIKGRLTADGTG